MGGWKTNFLLGGYIFRAYVSSKGCRYFINLYCHCETKGLAGLQKHENIYEEWNSQPLHWIHFHSQRNKIGGSGVESDPFP